MKDDVNDATEIGDLISTMPEVPWDSFEDELGSHQLGDSRLRLLIASDSVLFLFSRDLPHLLWRNTQSSELRHVGRIFDQLQRHITDCSHFFQKQVFQKNVFMAPRVAKSVRASLATTPNMSVASLLASSLVSTAVPSDAVSSDVSSLPSPVENTDTRRTGFSSRQGV